MSAAAAVARRHERRAARQGIEQAPDGLRTDEGHVTEGQEPAVGVGAVAHPAGNAVPDTLSRASARDNVDIRQRPQQPRGPLPVPITRAADHGEDSAAGRKQPAGRGQDQGCSIRQWRLELVAAKTAPAAGREQDYPNRR